MKGIFLNQFHKMKKFELFVFIYNKKFTTISSRKIFISIEKTKNNWKKSQNKKKKSLNKKNIKKNESGGI